MKKEKKIKENEIKKNAVKGTCGVIVREKAKEKTKMPSLEKSNDGVKIA